MAAEVFELNPIEAILFDGDNLDEVHDLLGLGSPDPTTPWLYSPMHQRWMMLRAGQWVVVLSTGKNFVLDGPSFDLLYGDLEILPTPEQDLCGHQIFAYDGTEVHKTVERELGQMNDYTHSDQPGILRAVESAFHLLPRSRSKIITVDGATRQTLEENIIRAARILYGDDGRIGIPDNYTVNTASPYDGTGGYFTTLTVFELER